MNFSGGQSYISNNSIDLGGNSGITINGLASRNLYWVGGAGDWSDDNHWSLTSGGPGGECVPNAGDNIFFDANSGFSSSEIVTIDVQTAYCTNMDWTGVIGNPRLEGSGDLYIYGDLTFSDQMENAYDGQVRFSATDMGNTVTMAGNGLLKNAYFEGTGEYILQDSLSCYHLMFYNGTLRTNDHPVRARHTIYSNVQNTRSLYLGNSIIRTSRIYFRYSQNLTLDAGTSKIILGGLDLNYLYSYGSNHSFYELESNIYRGELIDFGFNSTVTINNELYTLYNCDFNGPFYLNKKTRSGIYECNFYGEAVFNDYALIYRPSTHNHSTFNSPSDIRGSITADSLIFNDNAVLRENNTYNFLSLAPGYTYSFGASKTQTINDTLVASGSPTGIIQLKSTGAGTQAKLALNTNDICGEYLSIQDINNLGPANYYAGSPPNSQDIGNNNNIIFADCPPAVSLVAPESTFFEKVEKQEHLTIGRAFPNPSQEGSRVLIPIKSTKDTSYDILVSDQQGRIIYRAEDQLFDKEGDWIILDDEFPSGIYYYTIISEGLVHTDKIIILN